MMFVAMLEEKRHLIGELSWGNIVGLQICFSIKKLLLTY